VSLRFGPEDDMLLGLCGGGYNRRCRYVTCPGFPCSSRSARPGYVSACGGIVARVARAWHKFFVCLGPPRPWPDMGPPGRSESTAAKSADGTGRATRQDPRRKLLSLSLDGRLGWARARRAVARLRAAGQRQQQDEPSTHSTRAAYYGTYSDKIFNDRAFPGCRPAPPQERRNRAGQVG